MPFTQHSRRFGARLLPALALAAAIAACAPTYPNQPDFAAGTWDGQAIVPPPGLLTNFQGVYIGRRIDNSIGESPLYIKAVLVDPTAAQPSYVIASGVPSGELVIIPLTALQITATTITVSATHSTLDGLPNYPTIGAIEAAYPRTVVTAPTAAPPPAPMVNTIPPIMPAPVGGYGPLTLARAGSVVGLSVIDSSGMPVGRVDEVAVVPATGEVRYAIIEGPSFGPGYYIAVPSAAASVAGGQLVITGSLASWTQAPRYRDDQLPQMLGAS